jgi:hypothetical protein
MPNPFESLWEDRPAAPLVATKPPLRKAKPPKDHTEAKAIYAAYLKRLPELLKHQEYAMAVAKATDGPGMTPVKPLATMGCNGGPLLCDHCGKAIILESGPYYNVPADVAWAANPKRDEKWVSYIKGGLIVAIVDHGLLRIYHGYDGVPNHCYTLAKAKMAADEAAFVKDHSKFKLLYEYFEEEKFVDYERLASEVFNLMFSFDPGYGVNRPCQPSS